MKTIMYLHGDKSNNYEKAKELGLSEEATKMFAFALYEVEFEIEVDKKSGLYKILKVDGKELLAASPQRGEGGGGK